MCWHSNQCVNRYSPRRHDKSLNMMDGKSHAAAVAGELNAITAQVEDVGSLGELAEVMLEREAVYMGARALTDTRRERVVVEAIPSGGRVVAEPIPSDDGEEEEVVRLVLPELWGGWRGLRRTGRLPRMWDRRSCAQVLS